MAEATGKTAAEEMMGWLDTVRANMAGFSREELQMAISQAEASRTQIYAILSQELTSAGVMLSGIEQVLVLIRERIAQLTAAEARPEGMVN